MSDTTERIIREEARDAFDISRTVAHIQYDFQAAALQMGRPFMLLHPRMFPDGDHWCALYSDDLQTGG